MFSILPPLVGMIQSVRWLNVNIYQSDKLSRSGHDHCHQWVVTVWADSREIYHWIQLSSERRVLSVIWCWVENYWLWGIEKTLRPGRFPPLSWDTDFFSSLQHKELLMYLNWKLLRLAAGTVDCARCCNIYWFIKDYDYQHGVVKGEEGGTGRCISGGED